MERLPVTGVILAGGTSSRMGQNKAFLPLEGRPLITHVLDRLAEVCQEVLVVANQLHLYAGLGVRLVQDVFAGVGVLGGLHAGLQAATYELILAVGCDMPFLNPCLLRAFIGWADGYDAVVLQNGNRVEPLHAAYRRTCLEAVEAAIRAGQQRILSFFPYVRIRYLSPQQIQPLDPELRSFININTPEQWQAVVQNAARKKSV